MELARLGEDGKWVPSRIFGIIEGLSVEGVVIHLAGSMDFVKGAHLKMTITDPSILVYDWGRQSRRIPGGIRNLQDTVAGVSGRRLVPVIEPDSASPSKGRNTLVPGTR